MSERFSIDEYDIDIDMNETYEVAINDKEDGNVIYFKYEVFAEICEKFLKHGCD